MKKKILVCAFIAVCLSLVAYSTTAYFTYEDTAQNIITMGNIKIELQQLQNGILTPGEEAIDILPGTQVQKTVQVKNAGEHDAWIRISVTETIALLNGTINETDSSLINYDLNTEDWIEKDGYYYYTSSLAPNETTKPLFTEIRFSEQMGNAYQQSKAYIKVSAQATQMIHNGETVWDAAGWPAAE